MPVDEALAVWRAVHLAIRLIQPRCRARPSMAPHASST
jgi:hypothetical protein